MKLSLYLEKYFILRRRKREVDRVILMPFYSSFMKIKFNNFFFLLNINLETEISGFDTKMLVGVPVEASLQHNEICHVLQKGNFYIQGLLILIYKTSYITSDALLMISFSSLGCAETVTSVGEKSILSNAAIKLSLCAAPFPWSFKT